MKGWILMAKGKKIPTQVVKCQCSRCEQVAYVEPNKPHVYCGGIRLSIRAMLPPSMKDLVNPTKKGTWRTYVEPEVQASEPVVPVVQDATPMPEVQVA
jgi:hypothetical protein